MLSRLPTSLTQLEAGNNFEKLENENNTIIILTISYKKYDKASVQ